MKIRLTPDLLQKIPGIRVGVLVVKNIKNLRKNSVVAGLLRGVSAEKKRDMNKEDRKEKIAMHLKQTMIDNEVLAETNLLDSMLRKSQQGKEIKSENNAQDIAHYLMLKYLTPSLGRDLDQTEKDLDIGFIVPKKGKKTQDFDYSPETLHIVMWFVDIGILDREVFEKLPDEFSKTITKYCGGTTAESFILTVDNPEMDLNYVSEKETQYAIDMAAKKEEDAKKAEEDAKLAAEQERQAAAQKALEEAQKSQSETTTDSTTKTESSVSLTDNSGPTAKPNNFQQIIKHQLEDELSKAVKGLCETLGFCSKLFYEPVKVETPKDKDHGDYATSVALKLGKSINKTPREMVEMIQKNLPALPYIEKVDYAEPGFMNFTISKNYLTQELQKILQYKEHYGSINLGEGKKAMVEFSQPNIAKPLGVHHLLSTVIGQSIANILSFSNYDVVATNYLGDWGTQFGKLIYAFKNWGDRKIVEEDPINELLKLYVKFHDEAEKDPALDDKGREEFKKLEEGDEQNRNLWQWIREESIKDLDVLYGKLGIHFNEVLGESMYEQGSQEVLKEGKEKGIFVEGEKGAYIVKFENEEFPPYVVQKGDGTTLYSTRDIASIKDRLERFHPVKIVYVVDVAQSLHFKQLFATAKKFGLTEAELVHVVFGRMSLPEGRMSTRKGTVILLDELINEATERAAKVVSEKSKALTDAEKDFIADGVAIGAIKYQVLCQNRETNLTFDWDRMLSLEGNTAPYLQYSYARAASIIRKAKEAAPQQAASPSTAPNATASTQASEAVPYTAALSAPLKIEPQPIASGVDETQTDLFTLVAERTEQQMNETKIENIAVETTSTPLPSQAQDETQSETESPLSKKTELALVRMLAKFPEIVEAAAETYKPNLISNYLFELSQDFNSFYQDVQVVSTVNPELRQSRVNLVAAFAQVLKNGLHLLGITAFEKM